MRNSITVSSASKGRSDYAGGRKIRTQTEIHRNTERERERREREKDKA